MKLRIVTLISVLLLQTGCAGTAPRSQEVPLPAAMLVGETEEAAIGRVGQPMVYWLDNETVVFAGGAATRSGEPPANPRLYIWRIGQRPAVHAEGVWPVAGTEAVHNYFCASEGQIAYNTNAMTYRREANGVFLASGRVRAGPIGQERDRERTARSGFGAPSNVNSGFEGTSGRRCDDFSDEDMSGVWAVNFRRDLYLDFGRPQPDAPFPTSVSLVRPATGQRQVLPIGPILHGQSNHFRVETPAWTNGFVIWQSFGLNDEERTEPTLFIYTIDTRGGVSVTSVPNRPVVWNGDLIPSRDGFYFSTTGAFAGDMQELSGLYRLQRDGSMIRLASDFYEPAAVSPDGCRGAFYHRRRIAASPQTLAVLDLCTGANDRTAAG